MPDDPDDDPTLPVVCSDCGTETDIPLADAPDAIERHNDQLHDGEQKARVDPAIAEHVTDLVARDLGLLEDVDE